MDDAQAIRRIFARFWRDESGQDVMEYALLGAFVGTVGILAWRGVRTGLGNLYLGWNAGIQNISDCTPDPGGGGC